MRQVLKYEWKLYLLLTILLGLFMAGEQIRNTNYGIQWIHICNEEGIEMDGEAYTGEVNSSSQSFGDVNEVKSITQEILSRISYGFLEENITFVIILLMFLKCVQYRKEWSSSGREFLYFMPVKRRGKKGGYILLNILLIAGSYFIYMLVFLMYVYNLLKNIEVNVSWLMPAVFGAFVTGISYLFMILAVTEFLEVLFVEGSMKIFGVGGMWLMSIVQASYGFSLLYRAVPIRNIFGFLSLSAAGKQYYSFDDLTNPHSMNFWAHSSTSMDILFKGQPKECSMHGSAARLYDFRTAENYIIYVLGYLTIAALFIVLALWLSKREDLSKKCFHFTFVRYLMAFMIGVTFFVLIMLNAVAIWHEVLAGIASFCIFLGCNYIFNPCRHGEKEKQLNDSLIK